MSEGNPTGINGPHCPKCGSSNQWAYYSGADPDNADALRCEAQLTRANDVHECGYIYWRRNAPADADQLPPTRIAIPSLEVTKKRARVRALVHSMLVGNSYFIVPSRLNEKPAAAQVILFAVELDSLIEAAPQSDAGVKPLVVPCSHKYMTGEDAVSLRNGKCQLCGNQVAQ